MSDYFLNGKSFQPVAQIPYMYSRDHLESVIIEVPNQELKFSTCKIGQLYPVLVDYYGQVIDGKHRLRADKNWKKVKLEHIRTEKDRLVARIVSNVSRRIVSDEEKKQLLDGLARIFLNEGYTPGAIAYKIAEATGMSYRWVVKYMPSTYKDSKQSERAHPAARRTTEILVEIFEPPRRKATLMVKGYANTDFISLMIDKCFYEEFESNSRRLGIMPEYSIDKALEDYNEKMKQVIRLEKNQGETQKLAVHVSASHVH